MREWKHRSAGAVARLLVMLATGAVTATLGAACSDDSGSVDPAPDSPVPSEDPRGTSPEPTPAEPGTTPGATPGESGAGGASGAGAGGAASGGGDAAAPGAAAGGAQGQTAAGGAQAAGAQVYSTYCLTCHGAEGRGDGPAAAPLDPKPRNFAEGSFKFDPDNDGTMGEVEDIAAVVRNGAAQYGGAPTMVPWGQLLSDEQVQAVAEYVKGLEKSSS